jgi:hypothetical protein
VWPLTGKHAAIRLDPQSLFLENPCSGGSAIAVASTSAALHEKLNQGPSRIGVLIFGAVLVAGLIFKKAGRNIGFVSAKQFREIEGEDAEIVPAAAVK